jgi:hypothetical protein
VIGTAAGSAFGRRDGRVRYAIEWRLSPAAPGSPGEATDEKLSRGRSDRESDEAAGWSPDEETNTMARYLISFDDGSMNLSGEDFSAVGEASRRVVQEAKDAGVWIFGAGVERQQASIVATDGTVTDGPFPETKAVVGGFSIIEVPSREDALMWAAKVAEACRCAQEVREIMYDPES